MPEMVSTWPSTRVVLKQAQRRQKAMRITGRTLVEKIWNSCILVCDFFVLYLLSSSQISQSTCGPVVMKFKTFLLWCLVMQILAELTCPGSRNVSAAKALRDTNNPDCQTCALSNKCQVFLRIRRLLYNSKSWIHDRSNPNFLHFFFLELFC